MCTKVATAFTGVFAGAVLLAWSAFTAQALPAAAVQASQKGSDVTLVAEHCGVGWFRGPEGHCHRDRERLVVDPGVVVAEPRAVVIEHERVCPLGTHLGPHRHECIR